MRTSLPTVVTAATAVAAVAMGTLLLGGCTSDSAAPTALPTPSSSTTSGTASPSPSTSGSPTPSASPFELAPAPREVAASDACEQVRAGVDAFNADEYDETVARFEAAVPLAEAQADGSAASDQLLEAVRWYADLPAEDYREAFTSSPDFARYQAVTLSQCGSNAPGAPGATDDGGVAV